VAILSAQVFNTLPLYRIAENFGELQAKLHLAKKILADLSPAHSFFRYYKQLADKTLANS